MRIGGSGGIRTHGGVPPTLVFKTRALNHSATLPDLCAAVWSARGWVGLVLQLCQKTQNSIMTGFAQVRNQIRKDILSNDVLKELSRSLKGVRPPECRQTAAESS